MRSSSLAKFPAALALALACPAHAADLLAAHYDPASDQVTAEIAYRGTHPDHDFSVQWGQCSDASPPRVVGRLIDAQGDDIAREDYRVEARIGLEDIPCRPAIVTLRLGRVSHLDVFVPREIDLLSGTPPIRCRRSTLATPRSLATLIPGPCARPSRAPFRNTASTFRLAGCTTS